MAIVRVKITAGNTEATLDIDKNSVFARKWKRISSNTANVCPESGLWENAQLDLLINDNDKNPVMVFKRFGNAKKGDGGDGVFKAKGFAIAPNVLIRWQVTDEVWNP